MDFNYSSAVHFAFFMDSPGLTMGTLSSDYFVLFSKIFDTFSVLLAANGDTIASAIALFLSIRYSWQAQRIISFIQFHHFFGN